MSDEFKLPVKAYLDHLKITGKPKAAKTYGSLLNSFEKWLDKRGLSIENTTVVMVDEYLSTVTSSKTVQSILNAVRGYFRHRYMLLPMGDPSAGIELQRFNQLKMLRPRRRPKKLVKMSLTPAELSQLLSKMKEAKVSDELYAGVVVLFYFGARPGEMAGLLAEAKVSFAKREMFIQTEKNRIERYLAWHPKLDPYIKLWHEFVTNRGRKGLPYPGEWITINLKNKMGASRITGGVRVTSRTARRTFQTQMRLLNVPDIIIRVVLGHTDKTISDVYTDWTQYVPIVREAMTDSHYMIKNKVI